MMVPGIVSWLSISVWAVLSALGRSQQHEPCKDPLFATHWSGKNDIQTFLAFPGIKTNLKLCYGYNQRASCCHQMFEPEQQKYFDFWNRRFMEKLLRVSAHREALLAVARGLNGTSQIDREQLEVVLARYADVLSPNHQARCFSSLLTYVAGVICFGCKPEWFRYTLLEGDALSLPRVARVNVAESVCRELWDACRAFGRSAVALEAAIRDSAVARAAPLALEGLDMFMDLQQLCEWMQTEVALHPFQPLRREDEDLPNAAEALALAARGGNASSSRRLEAAEAWDVLREGRRSGFDRAWHSPCAASRAAAPGLPALGLLAAACVGLLGARLR